MSAQVHPSMPKLPPPTGMELMSGPITSGVVTTQQKEMYYFLNHVEKRLGDIDLEEERGAKFLFKLVVALVFGAGGAMLCCFGFRVTVLFNYYPMPYNYPAIVFGILFFIPCLAWLFQLIFPDSKTWSLRKQMWKERTERKKPTLYNEMVDNAKAAAKPPPRRIKVFAIFRKKEYPILAATMRDFMEEFMAKTGLPIERQLIRFQDTDLVDLEQHLHEQLDDFYHLDNGSRLYVYNKGGYFTQDSPLRHTYAADTQTMQHQLDTLYSQAGKKAHSSFGEDMMASWRSLSFSKGGKQGAAAPTTSSLKPSRSSFKGVAEGGRGASRGSTPGDEEQRGRSKVSWKV